MGMANIGCTQSQPKQPEYHERILTANDNLDRSIDLAKRLLDRISGTGDHGEKVQDLQPLPLGPFLVEASDRINSQADRLTGIVNEIENQLFG